MQHYGITGKNDGNMEGIPVDLDERSVKKPRQKWEMMRAWANVSAGMVHYG
jgi:hypothetical protein